jgi:glutamate--cysteine ligase
MFYLQNVARLSLIMRQAGLNVRLGSLSRKSPSPPRSSCPTARRWWWSRSRWRQGPPAGPEGFRSLLDPAEQRPVGRHPPILENINEQYLLPPLPAGPRRKSSHFAAYDEVAKKFAKLIDIDPWMVNPYFARQTGVNFHERIGEEALADAVEGVLKKIAKKYREYGIKETPFVVVKADAGTYGMGIMTVRDPSEVKGLNRKERNKMSVVKEGLEVSDVIIQEGVHTFEKVNDAVAEPVVYMIDRYVVGGFYRVHTGRGIDENLNAPGMHFVPLAFAPTACRTATPSRARPCRTASTCMAWWRAWPCWPRRWNSRRPTRIRSSDS